MQPLTKKEKTKQEIITWVIVFICLLICCAGCKSNNPHTCKWKLCPYEGVTESDYREAVIEYTGEDGTDSYCIDMLHLENPTLEYEELEAKLFEK